VLSNVNQKASQRVLVFDVGGTTTRAGIYDVTAGRLLRSVRADTPSFRSLSHASGECLRSLFYELMRALAERLGARNPAVVSVGFPGPVDVHGVALRAPTVWGSDHQPEPVAARLRKIWPSARILVANDLSAAGYTFLRHEADDFCVVTIGSGIGHKVFLGGHPVVGSAGRGGEIGHLRVDFSEQAPICDCGGQGHLGAIASGRGLLDRAMRCARRDPVGFASSYLARSITGDISRLENQLIAQAFHAEDSWTQDLIISAAEPVGRVLAGIHAAVGVERFVIMGGIAHALGPAYLRLVALAASRSEWSLGQDWETMLELGEFGDDAGLIGAGRLAAAARAREPVSAA
jgi:predicted NBD/HSP70 family sugar kinase